MASSKVTVSSTSKISDLTSSSSATTPASASSRSKLDQIKTLDHNLTSSLSATCTMTVDSILRNVYSTPSDESTLIDAQISLIDTPTTTLSTLPQPAIETNNSNHQEKNGGVNSQGNKTIDDVWREIVSGRKDMKEEPEEMMTLEDFLAKAGAVDVGEEEDAKIRPPELLSGGVYAFDPVAANAFQALDKVEGPIVGFGNCLEMVSAGGGGGQGRGKRGRAALMEPLDKAAQQRQRRMIKNRESAARSRERKQAYQVELEMMAVKLEEENERLLKEKEDRTKERFKQLMEKVVPVVEKRKPPRMLRTVHSLEW